MRSREVVGRTEASGRRVAWFDLFFDSTSKFDRSRELLLSSHLLRV